MDEEGRWMKRGDERRGEISEEVGWMKRGDKRRGWNSKKRTCNGGRWQNFNPELNVS